LLKIRKSEVPGDVNSFFISMKLLSNLKFARHFSDVYRKVRKSVFRQNIYNLTSSLGNRNTRTEGGYYTYLVQEDVVLHRDDTTGKYEDVFAEV